jgi:protoporphyrinogen oxidase
VAAVGVTRRQWLAGALAAPALWWAGCRRPAPRDVPDGELVGTDFAAGHTLVRAHAAPPRPERWTRVGTAIVGAGVAGLAAAWRLAAAGAEDFVVLELERSAGGTARSGRSPVVSYPWGAHYVPAPLAHNRAMVRLFQEMSLLDGSDAAGQPIVVEEARCRDPEERVFYRGRWFEGLYLAAGASDEDRAQLARFRREVAGWVGWRDARGRRAFTIPTAQASDDAEVTALDRISMAAWMNARGLSSPRLRWLVDYACRDDYGLRVDDTSAWAGLFYFASRALEPGDEGRPLVAFPEGNGRFVAHLQRAAGDRLRLGCVVVDVNPGAGGVELLAMAGGTPVGWRAERVVFAAPQFVARHLVRPFREVPPPHLAAFEYGAWMVANVHLGGRPVERGFPMAWDNVPYQGDSLGYVAATHQAGIDRGPTVLTYYLPLCDRDPRQARARLLDGDRRHWARTALADLGRMHPDLRTLAERVDVMRWGHAMVRPRVGFVWGGARERARTPYRGIHFANTDLSGVPLFEEALDQGTRAAEEVLAERGHDVVSWR